MKLQIQGEHIKKLIGYIWLNAEAVEAGDCQRLNGIWKCQHNKKKLFEQLLKEIKMPKGQQNGQNCKMW